MAQGPGRGIQHTPLLTGGLPRPPAADSGPGPLSDRDASEGPGASEAAPEAVRWAVGGGCLGSRMA